MGVAVDETGSDDPAFRIDLPVRRRPYPADFGYPAVPDAYIGPVTRHAGAVDYRAVGDNQVECHLSLPCDFPRATIRKSANRRSPASHVVLPFECRNNGE